MKKCLFAAALLCACVSANAQFASRVNQNNRSGYYSMSPRQVQMPEFDEAPGVRMRRTGRALSIIGGVMFVSGVALVSTADALYYNSTTTNNGTVEEGDPKGGFGVVLLAGGVGMMVPGIIFWSKGSTKYKHYQEQQSASIAFKNAGVALRFRF